MYFANELGAKDCSELGVFIVEKYSNDIQAITGSVLCHRRYINFDFLEILIHKGLDFSKCHFVL